MHPCDDSERDVPADALDDPFLYLPPPVEFTDEMEVIAERYTSHDIDWRYYPAFQAAAFSDQRVPRDTGSVGISTLNSQNLPKHKGSLCLSR
ncbi:MAG: hypothetical protein R3B91_00895 [Planctomycetaceae bacterium]